MDPVEIKPIPEWLVLLDQLDERPGLVFLLGSTHTGKSTLAQFLADQLCQRGHTVGYLDGDVGQSTLGPPATLNLALLTPPCRGIAGAPVISRYFVGSNAPGGHFLPLAVGLKKLFQKAVELGAEIILLDSTGFVSGGAARELKFQKIDLLSPRHLIVLQHSGEVESILQPFGARKHIEIHRLPVHSKARIKSPEERQAHRRHKYQEYFRDQRPLELKLHQVKVLGLTSSVEVYSHAACAELKGLLVGLNDEENFTLGVGVLVRLAPMEGKVVVFTPLSDASSVKVLRFGSLKLDPSGHDRPWRPYE